MTESADDKKIPIKARLTFLCWKCGETYSIYKKEVSEKKTVITCPYCGASAMVDFRLFKTEVMTSLKNATIFMKTDYAEIGYRLPKIIQTSKLK